MNRREFNRMLLTGSGALLSHPFLRNFASGSPLKVNGERLNKRISELSGFGKNPEGGVTRVAYSQADVRAREYVRSLMKEARLAVSIDAAGNIIGRRPGQEPDLPPLMTGSHIDSVPEGGNYDGPLGVIGAIEVVQTMHENNISNRHPLEVVVFANEEGGKTGSRAISGELTEKDLELRTHSGKTNREGIKFIGGDPESLEEVPRKPGEIAAFMELHIEQGAILERKNKDIGVVEGIVGIKRWIVTVEGFANHAGTTPMDNRRDALLAGARFVEAVNEIITSNSGRQVGTVGQIQASPGAPNVIPGEVVLSLEIRDLSMDKIDGLYDQIYSRAQKIGRKNDTTFSFKHIYTTKSALTNERFQQYVAESAEKLELSYVNMPSGAGHDAQSIARLAPIGMIFIPSVGGISHSPEEYSRPEDIGVGTNVLLHTMLKLDESNI